MFVFIALTWLVLKGLLTCSTYCQPVHLCAVKCAAQWRKQSSNTAAFSVLPSHHKQGIKILLLFQGHLDTEAVDHFRLRLLLGKHCKTESFITGQQDCPGTRAKLQFTVT